MGILIHNWYLQSLRAITHLKRADFTGIKTHNILVKCKEPKTNYYSEENFLKTMKEQMDLEGHL